MSNSKRPVEVPSDEEPASPLAATSANSTNQTPIAPSLPTPPPSAPIPSTEPRPPQPDEAGPSRWRQHLQARGTPHKRTARIRVRPPTLEMEILAWVPGVLDKWRAEAGLREILARRSASSQSESIPITREPIERTIPTLVVRADRHDHMLKDLQERNRQLDGYLRARMEPRVSGIEHRSDQNAHNLVITKARVEAVETETTNLREDLEEQADTITGVEEYIDLLEQRLEAVEDVLENYQNVTATLTRIIDHLRQLPPPPPPPEG